MSKLVVVLGPTASGKTLFAVNLAQHYNGEIISADSRQIYRGMDIGTGKDLDEYKINDQIIPYYLIDIINPQDNYSVYDYKNDFLKTYKKISKQNNLAILCGGTGLYIESILLDYKMSDAPPNLELRNQLENKTLSELIEEIKINHISSYDINFHVTKRRIIRTIEIVLYDNKNIDNKKNSTAQINSLVLGIKLERDIVLKNIKRRLETRLNEGMIDEVKKLIDKGLTLERLKYFGLEYKFIGEYLFNQISYNSMKEKLNFAINRFAKRQMTFFRRMEKRGVNINWIDSDDSSKIYNQINQFINS